MHRREFLKGSTAAVVTIGLSPWLIASTGPGAGGPLRKADFEALLHTWFHVGDTQAGWQAVELVAVRDDGTNARTEQFTLVFQGGASLDLAEGMQTVAPPAGDAFPLFLQPGGEGAVVARFSLFRPESLAAGCAGPA